jgi:hypothetical protein
MLLFGLILGLVFSSLAGLALAGIARLLTKHVKSGRTLVVFTGAALPVLCFVYFLGCASVLPGYTDSIDEPLPNGFHLTALKKMPDFAGIQSPSNPAFQLTECIASLQVVGPMVAGHYSHPEGVFQPNSQEGYFLLDTRNRKFTNYSNQSAVEQTLGQSLNLVDVFYFHSDEAAYQQEAKREQHILEIPLLAILTAYILLLLFVMSRSNRRGFPAE